jgi:hypothetical protein
MKKYCLIVGVTLVLVVGLSGCQEKNGTGGNHQAIDSRFIANWNNTASPDVEIWTFYANGTVCKRATQNVDGDLFNSTSWYNFTVGTEQLCFSSTDVAPGSPDICYTYSFSENLNRFMLSSNGVVIMDFVKIS